MVKKRYSLYLAAGITLWKNHFSKQYSQYFNKKIFLFEPGTINTPVDHRIIPVTIATCDLNYINNTNAVLAYMKHYKTLDGGPTGTDSTWECGYAIGKGKPVIMLIEDLSHMDYYVVQWMVSFSIGAILTTSKEVAEAAKNHSKFVHTTILLCENENQFENKIMEYLDNYYRSIYARMGQINYHVDRALRDYAEPSRINSYLVSFKTSTAVPVQRMKRRMKELYSSKKYGSLNTFIQICLFEQERGLLVEKLLSKNLTEAVEFLRSYIAEAITLINPKNPSSVAEMMSYLVKIPAKEVEGRKQGQKKTRPVLFYELYDLLSHHLVQEKKFFTDPEFSYKMGAVIEVYNWMNTYAIDDVFDNSSRRSGKPTLHVKYGKRNALLIGSIAHAYSLLLAYDLTKNNQKIAQQVLFNLNKAHIKMYQGQPFDIYLSILKTRKLQQFLKSYSFIQALELYFTRIYGICGAFYEEIAGLAGDSVNVTEQFMNAQECREAVRYIGRIFGIVQMIRNDLGDLLLPESHGALSKGMKGYSHNDFVEGKLTLLVLYVLYSENVSGQDKKFITKLLGKPKLAKKEKLRVNKILWESGAVDFAIQIIQYYVDKIMEEYTLKIHETPTRLKWIINISEIAPKINENFRLMAFRYKWKRMEPIPLDALELERINRLSQDEFNIMYEKNKKKILKRVY